MVSHEHPRFSDVDYRPDTLPAIEDEGIDLEACRRASYAALLCEKDAILQMIPSRRDS